MIEEQAISRIFDCFCKVCIRNEWISYLREQKKLRNEKSVLMLRIKKSGTI